MLIVMAGLPGTGKSTLAARLAAALDGVVLNKDHVRAALFPDPVLDYSTQQDEIAMASIYRAAAAILQASPARAVILDGRTFSRSQQVQDVLALAAAVNQTPHFIECTCAEDVARRRLEQDLARGEHPARNRTFALYLTVKAAAEPPPLPHLVLDTSVLPPDACVERCLAYLRSN